MKCRGDPARDCPATAGSRICGDFVTSFLAMTHSYKMKLLALTIPGAETPIDDPVGGKFTNLAGVVNGLLVYLFPIVGVLLFVYLIWGGFELLTSLGDEKKLSSAKSKVTNAVIGFIIIFTAYWMTQIADKIFGLKFF